MFSIRVVHVVIVMRASLKYANQITHELILVYPMRRLVCWSVPISVSLGTIVSYLWNRPMNRLTVFFVIGVLVLSVGLRFSLNWRFICSSISSCMSIWFAKIQTLLHRFSTSAVQAHPSTHLPLFQLLRQFDLLLDGFQQFAVGLHQFHARLGQLDFRFGATRRGGITIGACGRDDLVLGEIALGGVQAGAIALF